MTKKQPVKKHPKLPKKAPTRAATRRQAIAKGLIEGKTEQQMADELDMTRDGVKAAKAHPEFPATIADLLRPHQEQYEKNFAKVLTLYGELMDKTNTAQVRLEAAKDFIELVKIQQPKGNTGVFVGFSLEQIERMAQGGE